MKQRSGFRRLLGRWFQFPSLRFDTSPLSLSPIESFTPLNMVIELSTEEISEFAALPNVHVIGRVGNILNILVKATDVRTSLLDDARLSGAWLNEIVVVPYDPEPGGAGNVPLASNWGVDYLAPAGLWSDFMADGSGVKVGIADSGIDVSHPAFSGLGSLEYAAFNDQGMISGEKPRDSSFHGTHCAGSLCGGSVNEKRIGIAPSVDLKFARVLDGFQGTVASIKFGLEWLREQRCDVVSLSLGSPGLKDAWRTQLQGLLDDGVIVIVAAGNEFNWQQEQYRTRSPGNYPLDQLISVGAFDTEQKPWYRSGGGDIVWPAGTSFAGQSVRVPSMAAPGVNIVSAAPESGYWVESGTSMAAPLVAGVASAVLGLLRTRNVPNAPQKTRDVLAAAVVDRGAPGSDIRFGHGVIDPTALRSAISSILR